MSEIEKQKTESDEVVSTETKSSTKNDTCLSTGRKCLIIYYTLAILLVVVILLGVLFKLEKEGRSNTGIFDTIIANQEANAAVAEVNGSKITKAQLDVSIKQFGQAATAQGVDLTDPQVQVDIKKQALDVLVNTEILLQAATEQGLSVTDEEVNEKLASIRSDIGGEEVLAERMLALGITDEQLNSDIEDEILIQELLDIKFAEANIEVTEEDILNTYESVGGEKAGLPPIEEVREQVIAQITNSKEQAIIDEYIASLKESSEINIIAE